MVQLYTQKGLAETSARQVVESMATNHDFFVDVMMLEELQMAPPSDITDLQAAWRVGGSILVCGGTLPLCHALFSLSRPGTVAFSLTLGVATAALAYLGALRASITHQVNAAAPNLTYCDCRSPLHRCCAGQAAPRSADRRPPDPVPRSATAFRHVPGPTRAMK